MTEELKAESESEALLSVEPEAISEAEQAAPEADEVNQSAPEAEINANQSAPEADEALAESEPVETERIVPRRQSVVMRSGSCDMRVGQDVIDILGTTLKQVAGKPRVCLLINSPEVDPALVDECRRSLVDTGYDVRQATAIAGRAARSSAYVVEIQAMLAREGITADDPVVVVGNADLISGVLFVTSTWYGGCTLAAVPTTLDAMVEVIATPRYIDTPLAQDALVAKGNVRLALCDVDCLAKTKTGSLELSDSTLMGLAILAASAMVAGKNNFSDLAIAAEELLAADPETLTKEIMELTKARGRSASSTALAMRQGVDYGISIARALRACVACQQPDQERYLIDKDVCDGRLLAEAMRIAARLSAASKPEKPDLVDLVFAQDGLFERLGLSEVACVIEPEDLVRELRQVEFVRQNRFMPAIPLDYGRVRLSTIDDELIAEHVAAWCKARRKLARRRAKAASENN